MKKKYCTKCNTELGSDVKFCPECGSAVQEISPNKTHKKPARKNNKKLIIIITSIVLGLIIVGLVLFFLIDSVGMQKKASNSKSIVTPNVGNTQISYDLGNLSCNLIVGAQSVYKNDNLFYIADDGIYRTDNFADELKKDDAKKIADGKFACLNFKDEDIYCINQKDDSIVKLTNVIEGNATKFETCFSNDLQNFKIRNLVRAYDNLYFSRDDGQTYVFSGLKIDGKQIIPEIMKGEGTCPWLYASENSLKICNNSSSGWQIYEASIDSHTLPKMEKSISSTGVLKDIAFGDDKVYTLEQSSSSNSSKILISDKSGGRQEINLDCKVSKMLLSNQAMFLYSEKSGFLWFNTDTSMTHEINNNQFKTEKVDSININNNKFCALYKDGSIASVVINTLS